MLEIVADAGPAPSLLLQLVVNGVVLGSFYALLGSSVSTIYSTTRVFHFAHAFVYTAAAYVTVMLVIAFRAPVLLAVIAGTLVAVLLGIGIELGIYRPLRKSGATSLGIFLASLGVSIAGPNLVQIIFGPESKPLGLPAPALFKIGTATFTTWDIVTVVVSWVLIGGVLLLRRTRWGVASTAVSANRELAAVVGVSAQRVNILAFAVGSMLVGVAAALFVLNQPAQPTMGLQPILIGFIATFLGGIGSAKGAPIAGLVLGLVASISGLWISQTFQTAVVFGLLFIFLIVRPQGLFGKAEG